MINIKYFISFLFLFFVCNIFVYASCTNEEFFELKNKANDIKVSYKHLGLVESDDGDVYSNNFSVTINNIDDDFYLSISDDENSKLDIVDGIINITLDTGNQILNVYSNKCGVLIDKIKFRLPRFNVYSLDPLCDGIDGNDFRLCGKYYEPYVSYDDFVTRVKYYRSTHKIKKDEITSDEDRDFLGSVIHFIEDYKFYFIITTCAFILILFIILIVRKNKKRGVLE